MQVSPDDKLAAAVFALGLTFGFVRREDVVRWADRRIMEIDQAPGWLIDISLSHERHLLDLISDLNEVAKGTEPVTVFRATLGLLPDLKGLSFDDAEAVAKRVYEIASRCIGDWQNELFCEADRIDDAFALVRDGYCDWTQPEAVEQLIRFIESTRDKSMLPALAPAAWSGSLPKAPLVVQQDDQQLLVHVGLSAWIIQDGNYGDFDIGQIARFALEFYPPHVLRPVQAGPVMAEHLKASCYRIRGRVIFVAPTVWVIDAGTFVAYEERPAPPQAVVGTWVEGEVYLGIDPFFYFERLHQMEGMPPLTYTWRVRQIMRETTPMIEVKDEKGRSFWTRDQTNESFVPTRKTNAWHDDDGSSEYVLTCERMRGPDKPAAH